MAYPKQQKKQRSLGASLEMAQYLGAGTNKIKKRIRDIERLLMKKKDILPDTVIIEKERTLEALKLELQNAEMNQKAKKYSSQYHMVRFFERKKALKRYKQSLKKLETVTDSEREQINKNLLERKIDLCYVVNFPKTKKYISLYPTNDSNADKNPENISDVQRNTIRGLIVEQLEEGTLPVPFEEILKGKTLDKHAHGVDTRASEKSGDKSKQPEDEDEEGDDFFE